MARNCAIMFRVLGGGHVIVFDLTRKENDYRSDHLRQQSMNFVRSIGIGGGWKRRHWSREKWRSVYKQRNFRSYHHVGSFVQDGTSAAK